MIRSGMFAPEDVQRAINAVVLLRRFHRNIRPTEQRVLEEIQTSVQPTTTEKISVLMRRAVQEYVMSGTWTAKTKAETESVYALLIEIMGDHPIERFGHREMLEFRDLLAKLPPNHKKSPRYRHLRVKQILALPEVKPMSLLRVNKILSRLSAFFSWCKKHGFIRDNPTSGLAYAIKTRADEDREAYSDEDIKKMLRTPVFVGGDALDRPERFWLPLLGMYTGGRLNELAQLYISDVREIDGILCIDINDKQDKTVKSMSGKRVIPVHPILNDIGFGKYLNIVRDAGHARVFPTLTRHRDGYGHSFGQWFQTFNRRHITDNPKRVYHSFRHGVADQLKQQGINEILIAEILGHSISSVTMRRYGKSYRPAMLMDALLKLKYPVDVEKLRLTAEKITKEMRART